MKWMQGNGIIGATLAGFFVLAAGVILDPASAKDENSATQTFNRLTTYPNNLGIYKPDDELPGNRDKDPLTREKHPKDKPHGPTDLSKLETLPSLGALMAPNGIPTVAPEPKKPSVLHKLENRLPLMAATGLAETVPADGRGAALAALDGARPMF